MGEFNIEILQRLKNRNPGLSLLTAVLSICREQIPVVEIRVPSHPDANPSGHLQYDQRNYPLFRKKIYPDILTEIYGLALMDKTFPHSNRELMMMQTDSDIRPSFNSLSTSQQCYMAQTIINFGRFCTQLPDQITPQIAWNFDPYTVDRYPVQSVRRLHIHFMSQPLNVLSSNSNKLLRDYNSYQRRDLLDEAAVIASLVFGDLFESQQYEKILPFDSTKNSPYLLYNLGKKWENIRHESLTEHVSTLVSAYMKHWRSIMNIIFEPIQKSHFSMRGRLRDFSNPIETKSIKASLQSLGISDTHIHYLVQYLKYFKPQIQPLAKQILPKNALKVHVDKDKFKDDAAYLFPLSGPAYSILIYQDSQGDILLMFRPCFFTRTGGAGIGFRDNSLYVVQKGSGKSFTPEEIETRRGFQHDFLNFNSTLIEQASNLPRQLDSAQIQSFSHIRSDAGTMKLCYTSADPLLKDLVFLEFRSIRNQKEGDNHQKTETRITTFQINNYLYGYAIMQKRVESLLPITPYTRLGKQGYITKQIDGSFENLEAIEKQKLLKNVKPKDLVQIVVDFLKSICDEGCLDIWGEDNIFWTREKFIYIDPAVHNTLFPNENVRIAFLPSILHIKRKFYDTSIDLSVFDKMIERVAQVINIGDNISGSWQNYDNLHTLEETKMKQIIEIISLIN